MNGWLWRAQGAFSTVHGNAHRGTSCLKFDAAASTPYTPSVRQTIEDARPGPYILRFWLKAQDIKPPERGVAGIRVGIEYKRAEGKRAWTTTEVFNGTFDWRYVQLSLLLPEDVEAGSVQISVHRYNKPGSGEAFVDDVTLQRSLPSPVEAYLHYPNYRGYLPEDRSQRIRVWVRVNETEPVEGAQVEVTNIATGERVAATSVADGTGEGVVQFDATDWPLGRYAVRARRW